MMVLTIALSVVATLLLLPCLLLLVQVLATLLPAKPDGAGIVPQSAGHDLVDVCLLMPAHNEATGIGTVLQHLLPQLKPGVRLLVVADNCTDATAETVRGFAKSNVHMEVVERHNLQFRGKGYALDYGVQHLATCPPAVVVVVDADCKLMPNAIDVLVRVCMQSRRPIQALYLMLSPEGSGVKSQLAEFAWLVKNKVRALGFHQLGLPCQLMGTGMAFTWQHISDAKLNTGHIVEDMQLGIDLALGGSPPLFCPDALVTSVFPTTTVGLATQRTRWEHGHMGVILSQVPLLMWKGLVRRNSALVAMALDLSVPPLALLTLLVGGVMLISLGLNYAGGSYVPLALSAAASAMLTLAVLVAWYRYGRHVIGFWQLCKVPMYVLKKIPMYIFFFIKRQSSWVRSKRDGES